MVFSWDSYRLGDAVEFGVMFGWENWHLREIELSVDLGRRGWSLCIRFKGGKDDKR